MFAQTRGVLFLDSECCPLFRRRRFPGSHPGTRAMAGAERGWGGCGSGGHNHGSGLRLRNSSAFWGLFGLSCRLAFVETTSPFCFLTLPGFSGVAVAEPRWTGDRNVGHCDLGRGAGSDGDARRSTGRPRR